MSEIAPNCPISHSQQKISTSQQLRTGAADTIPPAHDLRSVITAINRMSSIISQITRGEPQVNNIYPMGSGGVPDPAPPPPFPGYDQLSWREVNREYADAEIRNPENEDQYIPIKTIRQVKWTEDATGNQLVYAGRK